MSRVETGQFSPLSYRVPGVEYPTASDPAAWVWAVLDKYEPNKVGAIIPDRFDSYVRIAHGDARRRNPPQAMPFEVLRSLCAYLAPATTTPDACVLCMWEGRRSRRKPHLIDIATPKGTTSHEGRRLSRRRYRKAGADPGSNHFLYKSPIADVPTLRGYPSFVSPNLWWPEDRAWCVATEVDYPWTYVGGSNALISLLLQEPILNAKSVNPNNTGSSS
jgi:hypothetical protein